MTIFYFVMMFLGIVLPYSQFVSWSMNGGSVLDIIQLAFANQISAGITLDALMVGIFLLGFIYFDSKKTKVKNVWMPILGIFVFGVSFSLPCYFYLRSKKEKD